MLKHMLNTNSSINLHDGFTGNGNKFIQTIETVHQNNASTKQSPENLVRYDNDKSLINSQLQHNLPTELEYQNTGISDLNLHFNRSIKHQKSTTVRSLEDICEPSTVHQQHCRGGSYETCNYTNKSNGDFSTFNSVLYSKGSAFNQSYAGSSSMSYPFQVPYRLNKTLDTVTLNRTNVEMVHHNTSARVFPNASLHIVKASSASPDTPASLITATKIDSGTDTSKCKSDFHNISKTESNEIKGDGYDDIITQPTSVSLDHRSTSSEIDRAKISVKEILTSLGLLCVISLLLALLSLILLLKISPLTTNEENEVLQHSQRTSDEFSIISPDEYKAVYEVMLALCSVTLCLNLCCLLVCAVQFLFAVKLARTSLNNEIMSKYLKRSAGTRVCAISGFFISIPVFLTGIILYTIIQLNSIPAIITSSLIGVGIIFCGCAMVHNVFVWQKEKTNAIKALLKEKSQIQAIDKENTSTFIKSHIAVTPNSILSLPNKTEELNSNNSMLAPRELSTLV